MERLIIDNRSSRPLIDVLSNIEHVLRMGRISNYGKQYCYVTTFANNVQIISDLNKKSDRLIILDYDDL